MSFPHGVDPTFVRVHPTPLYELAAGLLIGWWLWHRGTKPRPTGEILGEYLLLAGIARFLVEFIRRNPKILWGLSNAQIAACASAITGAVLIWWVLTRRVTGGEKSPTPIEKAA
jgi:phosphatidylglycerol:prolipoprotein diacylglycerol transferase